jgi:hypothetical protein
MVRIIRDQVIQDGKHYIEAACLHDDSKPATGIVTGSLCLEVDTGDIYAFDEEGASWSKVG